MPSQVQKLPLNEPPTNRLQFQQKFLSKDKKNSYFFISQSSKVKKSSVALKTGELNKSSAFNKLGKSSEAR